MIQAEKTDRKKLHHQSHQDVSSNLYPVLQHRIYLPTFTTSLSNHLLGRFMYVCNPQSIPVLKTTVKKNLNTPLPNQSRLLDSISCLEKEKREKREERKEKRGTTA